MTNNRALTKELAGSKIGISGIEIGVRAYY
jgi:hypothetical protein